jgi:hypothetical protein
VEQSPQQDGRNMTMLLAPSKKKPDHEEDAPAAPAAPSEEAPAAAEQAPPAPAEAETS